jgi:hypothetical protein
MLKSQIWLLLIEIDFYFKEANQLRDVMNDVSSIKLSLEKYYKEINVIKLLTFVTDNSDHIVFSKYKHLWSTWNNFIDKIKNITQKTFADDIVWIDYSNHETLQSIKISEFTYQEGFEIDAALILWEFNSFNLLFI